MANRLRTSAALATAMAALVAATSASANGRFPRAEHLNEHPSDPNTLYLAATYGLQVTRDRGCNWYHVCETAFSYQMQYTGDPILTLASDGALVVGTQSNVTLSADQACDWTQVLTSPASPKVSYFDFTVATTGSKSLLLVATTFQPTGPVNQLQESTDNGKTWKTIGAPLPAAVVNTIDIDPTNAMHIFATGLTVGDETPNSGVFMSSMDHGATWTNHPILNTFAWASP